MISLTELNPHNYPTTPDIDDNLDILLDRINRVRTAYNKPMTVTSGLRSESQQEGLIEAGKTDAGHSKHLIGAAVDIYDPDADLWTWCMINLDLLGEIELWLEDKNSTPNWVHFQIIPPASGKRVFKP